MSASRSIINLSGEPADCPFYGAFTFTYKEKGRECAQPESHIVKCVSRSQALLRYPRLYSGTPGFTQVPQALLRYPRLYSGTPGFTVLRNRIYAGTGIAQPQDVLRYRLAQVQALIRYRV
jgi:hypothetical protein